MTTENKQPNGSHVPQPNPYDKRDEMWELVARIQEDIRELQEREATRPTVTTATTENGWAVGSNTDAHEAGKWAEITLAERPGTERYGAWEDVAKVVQEAAEGPPAKEDRVGRFVRQMDELRARRPKMSALQTPPGPDWMASGTDHKAEAQTLREKTAAMREEEIRKFEEWQNHEADRRAMPPDSASMVQEILEQKVRRLETQLEERQGAVESLREVVETSVAGNMKLSARNSRLYEKCKNLRITLKQLQRAYNEKLRLERAREVPEQMERVAEQDRLQAEQETRALSYPPSFFETKPDTPAPTPELGEVTLGPWNISLPVEVADAVRAVIEERDRLKEQQDAEEEPWVAVRLDDAMGGAAEHVIYLPPWIAPKIEKLVAERDRLRESFATSTADRERLDARAKHAEAMQEIWKARVEFLEGELAEARRS